MSQATQSAGPSTEKEQLRQELLRRIVESEAEAQSNEGGKVNRGFVLGFFFCAALGGLAHGGIPGTSYPPKVQFASQPRQSRPHPAVVRVVAPGNGSISFGSGTLIAVNEKHGLIITNWHVINEATSQISVMFPDGFSSPANVLKVDRDWDLAALAIWKPNVAPVAMASRALRAGEMLTIAGYGSGTYREATGPCTQYVAPGTKFPYEMVELSASARQGDSGGPIFNDRGEIAGVLFGEGHGRTAGSYCGRVQWFLTSIVPTNRKSDTPTFVSIPGRAGSVGGSPPAPAAPPVAHTNADAEEPQQFASIERPGAPRSTPRRPVSRPAPPPQTFATASVMDQSGAEARERMESSPSTPIPDLTRGPNVSEAPSNPSQSIGWREIAGDSVGQQIKSVFAGVGVLALFLHTLALLGADRK